MSAILELIVKPGEHIERGNAHYWSVIRKLTEKDRHTVISLDAVRRKCADTNTSTIKRYLLALENGGILERCGDDQWVIKRRPLIAPSIGQDGEPLVSGQEAMWNAIRALGSFTAQEVRVSASVEDAPIPMSTVKAYLKRLNAAGYLKVEQKGTTRNFAIYRLKPAMNTGPFPPAVLKSKMVYDRNRREIMGQVIAEEDRP